MKNVSLNDLVMGMNDSMTILHLMNDNKDNSVLTAQQIYNSTKDKRRWSIINPGIIMAQSYMYFVVGQENNLLEDYPAKENVSKFINLFNFDNNQYQLKDDESKIEGIKRHLRNSIAHTKYQWFINSQDGNIQNDGNIMIEFEDYFPDKSQKKYYCKFRISFPKFANLIEDIGEYLYKKTI